MLRRAVALLLLPHLLAAGVLVEYRLLRCRLSGVTMRICCCPAEGVPPVSAISEACCCDVESVRIAPAAMEGAREELPSVVAAVVHVPAPAMDPRGTAATMPAQRGVGPPPKQRPLRLQI